MRSSWTTCNLTCSGKLLCFPDWTFWSWLLCYVFKSKMHVLLCWYAVATAKGYVPTQHFGSIQSSKVTQNLGLQIRRAWKQKNGSVVLGLLGRGNSLLPRTAEIVKWGSQTMGWHNMKRKNLVGPGISKFWAQLPNYFRSFTFASSALAHSTLEFLVTTLKSLLRFCFPLQAKLVPLKASRKRLPAPFRHAEGVSPPSHCFSSGSRPPESSTNHHLSYLWL